ncbi:MAG: general secretion pathway protein GspB [Gemmatimonadetes bacterium]|nr:general secretion pathway protein GspB [Gemmatimonadota bacterium]
MSFILDALRKSEHERQRQAGPGFAELRPAMARPTFPVWAIALAALLAINLVVLVIVMLRRDDATIPTSLPTTASEPAPSPAGAAGVPASPAPSGSPAALAATTPWASTEAPAAGRYPGEPAASAGTDSSAMDDEYAGTMEGLAEDAPEETEPELQPPPRATSEDGESDARLPTINDVALQGTTMPQLHLDIHVYATQPADRFVFLNNRKYREGGETPEGTVIERITRDGVVLNHRGVRFLLPRQ